MKAGFNRKREFLVAAFHRDRHRIPCGDEERGVDHVLWFVHRRLAHLKEDVAFVGAGIARRRVPHNFGNLRARALNGCNRGRNVDPDPAMPHFAKANEVAPDFFRGINRQSITGRAVVHAADENADDFAFEIQQGRARFAALRGQVHPQMRGGKIAA